MAKRTSSKAPGGRRNPAGKTHGTVAHVRQIDRRVTVFHLRILQLEAAVGQLTRDLKLLAERVDV